ncbi:unnamed protein product [Closterium sp. NIES-65]|nr:unnamed protein product [Closterium sp. NIES-65]
MDKGFILWSKELLYMAREDGGVRGNDPEIPLTYLTERRIGSLLTKTNELKRDMILKAADLPLGLDTFVSHVKLLKCWCRKSERWKLACGNFMQSPLGDTSPTSSREEVERERIIFDRHTLLNTKTPVGGQKVAAKVWEVRLGDLLCPDDVGGRRAKDVKYVVKELGGAPSAPEGPSLENPGAQRWAADDGQGTEG